MVGTITSVRNVANVSPLMIVIPMGIETLTFGPILKHFLGGSATNAILFGGVFFLIASVLALRLKDPPVKNDTL